ncbi:MAG TPA: glycosyltransferase family 39 protein [Gemmataceae bacterium]|jgi:4-amino-4-deoxy-L-arabinose transferase-like glycosyltransferase
MAEVRRLTLTDGLLLAAVVLVAAGTRAGYLMSCANYGRGDGPLRVETAPPELDALVGNLATNWRFASPTPFGDQEQETAHVSPGYPWLMALVGQAVDPAVLSSTMRWLQCGLGALTAGLYFLFARRVFQSLTVAVLAGLLCALHPFWILDTATLADGTAAAFLLALALFFGARASQTSGPLSSLLYGLALAALALMRAALLPFAFVSLGWFLLRSRTLTRGWLWGLLAFLGFIIGLAPWIVRNWQLYGEPVPIVDSTYYHLWVGNNPHATGGPASEKALHEEPAEELAKLPQPRDRYARLGEQVRHEVYGHPAETVRRRSLAGLDFLFGERWFTEGRLADVADSGEPPNWLAWSYPVVLESTLLGMVLLGLLGWRWTYAWRFRAMPLSLAAIWVPLPYILSHAEALSGPRLPFDGVLLCYAAFTLACLGPARRVLWAGEQESGSETESR